MVQSEELSAQRNVQDFKATEGWFTRFKKQEALVHKRLHGEGQTADVASREHWMENVWPGLKQRYDTNQIWNADESGVYIRALLDATLTFKNDIRKEGKNQRKE